ncbi:bcl-2-binding component 3 [Centropristis striata]|uniref:bcl-2-binding component 3 n=1 Tax=Centropristis striata TaxID=184440 RepID=UPI0027E1A486|nr:bcl-2-binding component 3 [Centropristis striata]
MARAETIESVAETGGRGENGPLPRHNTCRMELPRPFYNWPGLLTTTTISTGSGTGSAAIHLHHSHHHLHPLQAFYLSYPLPCPQLEGQDEPQTHQRLPALSPSPTPPCSPLCHRREERGSGAVAPSAFSGEQSDSDREERLEASSRQGPPPDLLPQSEHPSWASTHHRTPGEEAVQELEVRRVANQLRAIGDEFNATVLHRVHPAPHWQDLRDACRGLLSFISQTLSTLYRLT